MPYVAPKYIYVQWLPSAQNTCKPMKRKATLRNNVELAIVYRSIYEVIQSDVAPLHLQVHVT